MGNAIAENLASRFEEFRKVRSRTLRLSNIGMPLRKLWFEVKSGLEPEALRPENKMKYLFGDILEDLMILLAMEAGHAVTDLQKEVEVDGVKGHIDCVIDGVLVDVKSASSRAFEKFTSLDRLRMDDPFGYIGQLAAYSTALGGIDGAFLVIDKQLGKITLLRVSKEELRGYQVEKRIKRAREVLAMALPPDELCYDPIPDGKSGNLKLPIGCAYCGYKQHCYPKLRTFLYSKGPVYLTKVVRTPEVFEVINKGDHGQHDRKSTTRRQNPELSERP